MNLEQRQQRDRADAALELLDAEARRCVLEALEQLNREAGARAARICAEYGLSQIEFEQLLFRFVAKIDATAERIALKTAGRLN